MSYAANPARLRSVTLRDTPPRGAQRSRTRSQNDDTPAKRSASGSPYDESLDWNKLLLLGGGIAAGAALGAGVAMLFTTRTGPQRRAGIARGARRFGHRTEQAWEDLAFELREAAKAARDKLRRHRAADAEVEVDD
jgi:hypothetical protein